jgi:hypothetical protein
LTKLIKRGIKKFKKILLRSILGLVLLLLTLAVLLTLPFVQTKIASYLTEQINHDFGTDIKVDKVAISIFGSVKLKGVLVRDHHADTLFHIKRLQTNILSFKKLGDSNLLFGTLRANHLYFNLKTYKGEKVSNLDLFIAAFDDGKPSSGKFVLKAEDLILKESRFVLSDYNRENPVDIDFYELNGSLKDFEIKGSDVTTYIEELKFKDFRGLVVNQLEGDFLYTKKNILIKQLFISTPESSVHGSVVLTYQRSDFENFNNKVNFQIDLKEALISSNDIRYFYDELGANQKFYLKTKLDGTLNNFNLKHLILRDDQGTLVNGSLSFRNLFSKDKNKFRMIGDFNRVESNYDDLVQILPNILGNSLPNAMRYFGNFTLKGTTDLTVDYIKTNFSIDSSLGRLEGVLDMNQMDNIDNAIYQGNLKLQQFDIGKFIGVKDLEKVTAYFEVKGQGLTQELLDVNLKGQIDQLYYNQYNYTNILADGRFKMPFFSGKLNVNDPNLFMDFDGTINLADKIKNYEFEVAIDYANLHELNFVNDSISVFRGNIISNLKGNNINDFAGNVYITQSAYQNARDIYVFDDLKISSYFDENKERVITLSSPDIVDGKIVGKFYFEEVIDMVENALGSIYTNYKPNKVRPEQYLKFQFSIYNKIIEIFYPEIELSSNTFLRGTINSDDNVFKMNFNTPQITAFDNKFHKIKLEIDNKNPIYNTYLEVDSIRTPYYKIADISLINLTINDTLYFRSEFKGGEQDQDYYNINVYHSIDNQNQSIVGIQKSELHFKDYLWYLNENEDERNRIITDKKLINFLFEDIQLTHENQKITLNGGFSGKDQKDIQLSFKEVNLNKIIPVLDDFYIEGALTGEIDFKQEGDIFQPESSIIIDDLKINSVLFGNLNLNIEGDETFKIFNINSTIRNQTLESFSASGIIEFIQGKPEIDLDLRLDRFNIGAFSNIGGEVISDIRGLASGTAVFSGRIENPEIDGRIFLNEAGLKIPYLNIDYALSDNSIIDLTRRQFLLRNIELTDTKYKTKGRISGNIRHNNLSDWKMDLSVNSDYLNVLDTEDSEDAIYFGKAFISGTASLTGPTNALLISVDATSEKGTSIKIPVADSESIGETTYIRFKTYEEKYGLESENYFTRNYGGLELDFDLNITNDAEIEVILNRETNHMMRGRGSGNLNMQINTLGKFNMYGDITVKEGLYNFNYRGLIRKQFKVVENGSIVWEGDPLRARLNLEAKYDNIRANPAILLDNPTVNQKVPVQVVIGITGNLSNPDTDFTINFPTISSVLKSEIETKLADRDTRQTQAIYLLASGNFLSPDGGLGQNSLSNNLFENFTGVFNDLFKDEDGKINVGVMVDAADRTPGRETDGSVGVTGSIEINERISVNGKLGVPIGGINEAAVVGDVEILYRVNRDGTLNLRVFNRENDITYIGEVIGYTQGLGVSYQVDFDNIRELISRIFTNAKSIKEEKSNGDDIPDSFFNYDFIRMVEEKRRASEKPKTEKERVPEID